MTAPYSTRTHRRIRPLLLAAAGVALLLAAGALWWIRAGTLPQAPAAAFLMDSPVLELPTRPEGLVVLAKPGRWSRFFARNPERSVLLDPAWWRSLRSGRENPGTAPHVPGTAVTLLLDQFRHGLAMAWWKGGWIVQGPVSGGSLARRLSALLPPELEGKWRLADGFLRIASDPSLLAGRDWTVTPNVDPSRRLACWAWLHGAGWPGWWEDGTLVFQRGHPAASPWPEPRGALLLRMENGLRILDLLGKRLPAEGLLAGVGRQVGGLLERPAGLWLRRLEAASPLPHPLMALELELHETEDGKDVADALRELLCPFGCRPGDVVLSDGRPAEAWASALGSWWVVVLPHDAVVAATDTTQLETFLAIRRRWPGGNWAVLGAPAAAGALSALSSARFLSILGLVRQEQLIRLHKVAVPLRGLKVIRWRRDEMGARIEVIPAPDR